MLQVYKYSTVDYLQNLEQIATEAYPVSFEAKFYANI